MLFFDVLLAILEVYSPYNININNTVAADDIIANCCCCWLLAALRRRRRRLLCCSDHLNHAVSLSLSDYIISFCRCCLPPPYSLF